MPKQLDENINDTLSYKPCIESLEIPSAFRTQGSSCSSTQLLLCPNGEHESYSCLDIICTDDTCSNIERMECCTCNVDDQENKERKCRNFKVLTELKHTHQNQQKNEERCKNCGAEIVKGDFRECSTNIKDSASQTRITCHSDTIVKDNILRLLQEIKDATTSKRNLMSSSAVQATKEDDKSTKDASVQTSDQFDPKLETSDTVMATDSKTKQYDITRNNPNRQSDISKICNCKYDLSQNVSKEKLKEKKDKKLSDVNKKKKIPTCSCHLPPAFQQHTSTGYLTGNCRYCNDTISHD